MANNDKIEILGIKLDSIDRYQALSRIEEMIRKQSASLICTVNVEFVMRALKNQEFKKILNSKSAMNTMDGSGILWAYSFLTAWSPRSRVLRKTYIYGQWLIYLLFYPLISAISQKRLPKVSGADFVWDICQWASENNKKIFILGNKAGLDPNATQKASLELQTKVYNLKIAAVLDILPEQYEDKKIVETIKKAGADILFCALGSPHQEMWLAKNLGRSGATIGIGLGGTFDFIAGVQKRAPAWIRTIGLEWLFRLIRQPNRVKRQRVLPQFAMEILKERLREGTT